MTLLLEIEDLHVAYGKVEAIRGVSLKIEAGQIVTVIGPNGAGKTTLLAAAAGLLRSRGGLDRAVPLDDTERLAEWLDAEFEPFGAHSHYGLVVGEQSFQQVAESIRAFLETNRL